MNSLHRFLPRDDGVGGNSTDCPSDSYVSPGNKDTQVQAVISFGLGIVALFGFCLMRPRWKSLYDARRRRHPDLVSALPVLPDSFFGWLPALLRISEDQVLASAGLDAFVFLAFFKMSIKLFAIMFFFAAVVLEPINQHFLSKPKTQSGSLGGIFDVPNPVASSYGAVVDDPDEDDSWNREKGHLWAYLVFIYFFTGLTYYFMRSETFRVIKVRQEYLGSQATITDRTFRLSGIPSEFRAEDKIKALIEKLEIGRVESVTLCRKWGPLDALVAERGRVLQKLEETWSVYLAQPVAKIQWRRQRPRRQQQAASQAGNQNDVAEIDEEAALGGRENAEIPANEGDSLLPENGENDDDDDDNGDANDDIATDAARAALERNRPQVRIWYGPLRMRYRYTDAIDYYEERLRRLDEKIRAARRQHYDATDLAFVTMDSVAACQMAIQAVLDPRPGELLARFAPAPSDVIWPNTYASRTVRRSRAWIITIFITVLSIVWLIPVASLASLLSLCTIQKWAPKLAEQLSQHDVTKALVQTGLPTAVVSLLNVAVPYLYEYLSNRQGMLSQGDVELSLISKNFFFTFFNIFLVFTVFGTATRFWTVLRDSLHDTTYVAYALAREVQRLNVFYLNFVMLQALGLFPLRLLEFGSVAQYPINRLGAKTPRDRAQISTPPIFSYGFFLPTALLVFILCLVYSVMPRGFLVLLLGFVYFVLGYTTYKYQLLYAMDQPQHATGGAWRIICYRILLGLAVFHLTMSGYLGANKAYVQATLVLPLFFFTVWYMYFWRGHFEPLTHNIALLSVRRDGDASPLSDEDVHNGLGNQTFARRRRTWRRRRTSTLDENRDRGSRFVNPSLVVPLVQPWIYKDPPPYEPHPDDEVFVNGDSDDADADDDNINYIDGILRGGGGGGPDAPGPSGLSQPSAANGEDSSRSRRSASSSFSLGDTHIWRDANTPPSGGEAASGTVNNS
ncbi:hypothetical protein SPBR_01308 [Sporothrix brasiliensis 5110]|uniref:DUF221 domain protein n=1 Tax=Sporothrix brasiliensis 5110 TaxID=1398154 RepID=A0A0C2IYZ3_9PEZI|nr:uncharacterized protein SPBR_01308 [Sporothrix brasiliensis 5110]KIH91945.1 hypothetical protein SPBR_01308 [Sporothrix brasiliensis 5110]